MTQLVVPMQMQMLYYDASGNLQSAAVRCEQSVAMASDPRNSVDTYVQLDCWPQAAIIGHNVQLTAQCQVTANIYADQGIPMVSGITAGDATEPDPARPSVVLRRKGSARLWDIAKELGSTVEHIKQANALEEEPEDDKMLLIPVI